MGMLSSLLSRIGLRYQVLSGAALGIIGLVVIAAAIYSNSRAQARLQLGMDRATAGRAAVLSVEIDLLQARRHEKDFLLRRTDEPATRHAAAAQAVREHLDGLQPLLSAAARAAQRAPTQP